MSQYPVKGTCGHTYTYQLYGPMKERARKEAWLATQLCPDCRKAAELSGAQQATAQMPALTGSEKQIAWATKIRATSIAEARESWERRIASAVNGTDAQMAYLHDVAARSLAWLETQSSAKWWIDHRDDRFWNLSEIAVRGATEEARLADYTSFVAAFEQASVQQ